MERNEILAKLKELFEELAGDSSNVVESTSFKEGLGLNSIAMLTMAMAIESEFGIKFKNDDLLKLKTVKDAVDIIYGHTDRG